MKNIIVAFLYTTLTITYSLVNQALAKNPIIPYDVPLDQKFVNSPYMESLKMFIIDTAIFTILNYSYSENPLKIIKCTNEWSICKDFNKIVDKEILNGRMQNKYLNALNFFFPKP